MTTCGGRNKAKIRPCGNRWLYRAAGKIEIGEIKMQLRPRTREEWENLNLNQLRIEFAEKNYAEEIKKVADKYLENCAYGCSAAIIGECNISDFHKSLLCEEFKTHIKKALKDVFSIESIKAIEKAMDYKEISRKLKEEEHQKEAEDYKDTVFED